MGLYDRDYAYDREPGIHLSAPKSLTVQVVLFTVAVYVLQLLIEPFTSWFALGDGWYRRPWQCYQLLTYGFLHDTSSAWHIALNMFMFWMFGREIEEKYGRRAFLLFYLWAIVFAGLMWSFSEAFMERQATLIGASGGVSGVFVLFALNFPRREVLLFFVIPLPVWVLAAFGVLVDLSYAMTRSGNIAGVAHLAGAVAGLYFYKFGLSPFAWIADRCSGISLPHKPKLRIHDPDQEGDDFDEEVNRILRKIHEHGQSSLSAREQRTLQQASQQYQRKRL